jgi:UDP-4-amino-4,6-dideoxy-N-acetyl-beta-L-altrosamine transaminase
MRVDATPADGDVHLAPLLLEHVGAAYVEWLSDPEVTRFIEVWGPQTPDAVRAYVCAANESPTAAIWRIMVDGTRHVGNIRLSEIKPKHGRAEVALMIGERAYWGKGVGSRAIRLVSDYAFNVLGLHKLTAGVHATNVASRRAFERAGFNCEATLNRHAIHEGHQVDTLMMSRFAPIAREEDDENAQESLPYGRQTIDAEDIGAVRSVLGGDWLTTGPALEEFESTLARRVNARFAVACANGTAGLHLSAIAAGIGNGDMAIVPAITFLATANAVRYVGAEVVFADVDPATGLMDAGHVAAAIRRCPTGRATAVLPVHYAGQCADPQGIADIANAHGIRVIDDAAHAIGTTYSDKGECIPVGSCRHADMTVFSFHPVKTITMGEGGAVTTNDARLADRLRQMRNHGMIRDDKQFTNHELAFDRSGLVNPWYYEMKEPGFNFRANDIQCALGISQIAKLDRFVSRRRTLVSRYDGWLENLSPMIRPLARVPGCRAGWHLYGVRIDFAGLSVERADLMRRLKARGIGTQVHYIPVHFQPYYRERYGKVNLPGAEEFYRETLSLPLFPAMREADVDRVVEGLTAELGLTSNRT